MNLEKILEEEYKQITPAEIGKVKTEKTYITDQLLKAFSESLNDSFFTNEFKNKKEYFAYKIKSFQNIITPEEITNVSLHLSNLQTNPYFSYAGYFLTALIDLHREETNKNVEYKIMTDHLEKNLEGIGYQNRSHILIDGNGGGTLGYEMISGKITVVGNCQYNIGFGMKGGKITITGNVGHDIGHHMTGGEIYVDGSVIEFVGCWMHQGKITVTGNVKKYVGNGLKNGRIDIYGNAGNEIGLYMQGGEIHLYGEYEDISNYFVNGKIYHKNKCIQTKWKKIVKQKITGIKSLFKK